MRSASLGDGVDPEGAALVSIAFNTSADRFLLGDLEVDELLKQRVARLWIWPIRLSNSDNEPKAVVSLMCFCRASVMALGAGAGGDSCCGNGLAERSNAATEARRKRRFICGFLSAGRASRPEAE